MQTDERVILRGPRLLLRPVELGDVPYFFANGASELFRRFLPLPEPYTLRDAERFVASILLRPWGSEPAFLSMLDGEPVGDVSFRTDTASGIGELGWGVATPHWGKGYAAEAARLVIRWAFPTFDLAKVLARCDAENVASWRVMEKLGMVREAHLRSQRLLHGKRRDELIYGILRDEFERDAAPDASAKLGP